MSDYIISTDAGNGGTNAVMAKTNGGFKSHYVPSVRASATGASLGLGKGMELQYEYVDWNGHRYVVGDDVIRVTRRNLERHMGGNRYGNEFHQFLVATAVAGLGVKEGTVDLTLFAPPGMFLEAKRMITNGFTDNKGFNQTVHFGNIGCIAFTNDFVQIISKYVIRLVCRCQNPHATSHSLLGFDRRFA